MVRPELFAEQLTAEPVAMESILANEEEHAEDLSSLLEELGKKGEPAKPSRQ